MDSCAGDCADLTPDGRLFVMGDDDVDDYPNCWFANIRPRSVDTSYDTMRCEYSSYLCGNHIIRAGDLHRALPLDSSALSHQRPDLWNFITGVVAGPHQASGVIIKTHNGYRQA